MTIEKLNNAKNGPKGTANAVKEHQKLATKPRRETTRQRNGLRNEAIKRPKKVQVIWQRLISGQTDRNRNNTNKIIERNQSPYTTRTAKRARNEPVWKDLLAIEKKSEKKMAKAQTIIVSKEIHENGEPRTAFSIKMEKKTKRHLDGRHVVSPSLDQQHNVNNVEPIEEFRVFFDNLFSYLQPRVPTHERDFLITERNRFNAFFERLKEIPNDETQNERIVELANLKDTSSSTKTVVEVSKVSTFLPTSQDGKMIAIGIQTSFPTSTNSDNESSERLQKSSIFQHFKQQMTIAKFDKATQAPDESEKSSNETTEGLGSSSESSETESDKNKNKHKQKNHDKKKSQQNQTEGKAPKKLPNKALGKKKAISNEIEALEKIKEDYMHDPNMHHLLKSLRSFYKQLRKEQREHRENEYQISTPEQKTNLYEFQQSQMLIEEVQDSTSKSIQIIANLQQKRHTTMHVAFEDAADVIDDLENASQRNTEIQAMDNTPITQNEFQFQHRKKNIGNNILAANDSLEKLKKEFEKRRAHIEQENVQPINPSHQSITDDGLIAQKSTKDSLEKSNTDIDKHEAHIEEAHVSLKNPTYEWLTEDGSLVRYPCDFLNEHTSIVTDQIEKSTLDHLKQKCMDLQRVQDLEIENALKYKPEINENELLHKLDSNMDEMQTDLIKLGKYYNYLPLGFFNRTYNEKWHTSQSQEPSLLLESFKHCYPQQNTNFPHTTQNIPDLKIKNETFK